VQGTILAKKIAYNAWHQNKFKPSWNLWYAEARKYAGQVVQKSKTADLGEFQTKYIAITGKPTTYSGKPSIVFAKKI